MNTVYLKIFILFIIIFITSGCQPLDIYIKYQEKSYIHSLNNNKFFNYNFNDNKKSFIIGKTTCYDILKIFGKPNSKVVFSDNYFTYNYSTDDPESENIKSCECEFNDKRNLISLSFTSNKEVYIINEEGIIYDIKRKPKKKIINDNEKFLRVQNKNFTNLFEQITSSADQSLFNSTINKYLLKTINKLDTSDLTDLTDLSAKNYKLIKEANDDEKSKWKYKFEEIKIGDLKGAIIRDFFRPNSAILIGKKEKWSYVYLEKNQIYQDTPFGSMYSPIIYYFIFNKDRLIRKYYTVANNKFTKEELEYIKIK